jgi:mannose-6-phosphate isomerase
VLGAELAAAGLRQFPLLAKFLDAHENLSVQVHPDDVYAQQHEGVPFGKAEFWYILETEPGARIIHGPAHPMDRETLLQELEHGDIENLQWVPVTPGDVVLNLPGTMHATGAGIVLYELQQSSDVTYRLYDWDRGEQGGTKRELHLDSGMDVSDLQPLKNQKIEPVAVSAHGGERTVLCACRYFAADLVTLPPQGAETYGLHSFHAWTVLSGEVTVEAAGARTTFRAGRSFVVPAGLKEYTLSAPAEGVRALRAYVPDLKRDVLEPLEAQGVPRERIFQLAGDSGAQQFGAE